jgi:hypothetical protein
MTPETRETCIKYLRGYASAKQIMLWDRQGSDDGWEKEKRKNCHPRYYWCPSVRIDGKQHVVVGPNKYLGQYTRKEAVAQAQGFLDQCRALLDEDPGKDK